VGVLPLVGLVAAGTAEEARVEARLHALEACCRRGQYGTYREPKCCGLYI
jgi:hypothetical protein